MRIERITHILLLASRRRPRHSKPHRHTKSRRLSRSGSATFLRLTAPAARGRCALAYRWFTFVSATSKRHYQLPVRVEFGVSCVRKVLRFSSVGAHVVAGSLQRTPSDLSKPS
jgi:hypothetical protein